MKEKTNSELMILSMEYYEACKKSMAKAQREKGKKQGQMAVKGMIAEASGGTTSAMCDLGVMYYDGYISEQNSKLLAFIWIARAAKLGDEFAQMMLKQLFEVTIENLHGASIGVGVITLEEAIKSINAFVAHINAHEMLLPIHYALFLLQEELDIVLAHLEPETSIAANVTAGASAFASEGMGLVDSPVNITANTGNAEAFSAEHNPQSNGFLAGANADQACG